MGVSARALATGGILLSRRPCIRMFEGLLGHEDCRALQLTAASRMGACELSETGGAAGHERSSTGCWLPRHDAPQRVWREFGGDHSTHDLVKSVEILIAESCGIPISHGEPMQILRYRNGQRYETHPDFFDPRDRAELANGGQRVMTCLIYLASLPASWGGATVFPDANIRVQPVAGRAIIWRNVRSDGAVDPSSVHAGALVRRPKRRFQGHDGDVSAAAHEKWVLSKWIRARPFQCDHSPGLFRGGGTGGSRNLTDV